MISKKRLRRRNDWPDIGGNVVQASLRKRMGVSHMLTNTSLNREKMWQKKKMGGGKILVRVFSGKRGHTTAKTHLVKNILEKGKSVFKSHSQR